jgi:hypothetical protein
MTDDTIFTSTAVPVRFLLAGLLVALLRSDVGPAHHGPAGPRGYHNPWVVSFGALSLGMVILALILLPLTIRRRNGKNGNGNGNGRNGHGKASAPAK